MEYLNTDLDLQSDEDLRPLVASLQHWMFPLQPATGGNPVCAVTLELREQPESSDDSIHKIRGALASLSNDSHRLWRSCKLRRCSVGYKLSEGEEHCGHVDFSARALEALAAIEASLQVCIYGDDDLSEVGVGS